MILRKTVKEFEQADEGQHLAVLADVEDRGKKMTPWGLQEQVRFKWLVQQLGKDGKQLSVIATYNKSLNENAKLVQAITDITGTPPQDGFDTETMIGANNRLTLKHQKKLDGSMFPKIVAILRPAKGDPILRVPDWFKRSAGGNNAPPSAAAATAPPKAPVPNATSRSKPAAEQSSKSVESVTEPPAPADWDASEYDEATSFPSSDAGSDQHAA